MAGISTHVLDTSRGAPATGLTVTLAMRGSSDSDLSWTEVRRGETDADGRLAPLWPPDRPLEIGLFRLTFDTGSYFRRAGGVGFYPEIRVCFEIRDASQHHHVPLLLSPFGYSTYRGS